LNWGHSRGYNGPKPYIFSKLYYPFIINMIFFKKKLETLKNLI